MSATLSASLRRPEWNARGHLNEMGLQLHLVGDGIHRVLCPNCVAVPVAWPCASVASRWARPVNGGWPVAPFVSVAVCARSWLDLPRHA